MGSLGDRFGGVALQQANDMREEMGPTSKADPDSCQLAPLVTMQQEAWLKLLRQVEEEPLVSLRVYGAAETHYQVIERNYIDA